MKISEMREKQQRLVAEARSLREEIKDDTAEARIAEIDAAHDAAMAEYDRLEARIKREEALEARERDLNAADDRRPNGEDRSVQGGRQENADEARAAAFRSYLRHGLEDMPAEERKIVREMRAQAVGTDSKGGYLVPEGFMAELVKSLKAWGPMLDPGVTRVLTTTAGNSIPWPTMDDTSNEGSLIGENTQVTETEVAFGTKTLEAYKYTSGVVLVSAELLQDSAIDVEGTVRSAMAERIGRIGNRHLTVGDGSAKPNGIVTAATAVTGVAAAAALTFDDMIELFHAVDPAYRDDPSVRFMFNDGTLKSLRKIKDTVTGNYIWQPADVRTGAPATILDKPYSINQAMAAIGASNKSVAFGAFNRYVVRMVREFAIRRLVERYADYDQTGFIGFTRLDGELLDASAVKVLQHAAS
ncbi:phage major capsid protein [Sinorhizobium meliloti]|uniref:phage major capsid protein n=1 Tax=Rhizobium meliloti TaxID=382 RepID=UPI000FD8225D|nr:phage major capsid protein [Sinorhizobium meliloti]TWB03172.1 HK97 family phage major capsid protein [Ensifer sp. SEMIA 134]TWB39510.1 HK97 family phage major capsid protein [Ensifer sp. SEMIA 135]RVG06578.1 phage major capsid protein [Sinorhizobium meliloti]RVL14752.1 phage major capsid protein [Sinorhizobium meliloti]RVP96758.1 phage major capsid protein [Sinorhizobium meliloti]